MLKKQHSIYIKERWDLKPFETQSKLEDLCNRKNAALFVFGYNSQILIKVSSNTKKRPNSLCFGRIFDEHLLDMLEFEITNYKKLVNL